MDVSVEADKLGLGRLEVLRDVGGECVLQRC